MTYFCRKIIVGFGSIISLLGVMVFIIGLIALPAGGFSLAFSSSTKTTIEYQQDVREVLIFWAISIGGGLLLSFAGISLVESNIDIHGDVLKQDANQRNNPLSR